MWMFSKITGLNLWAQSVERMDWILINVAMGKHDVLYTVDVKGIRR